MLIQGWTIWYNTTYKSIKLNFITSWLVQWFLLNKQGYHLIWFLFFFKKYKEREKKQRPCYLRVKGDSTAHWRKRKGEGVPHSTTYFAITPDRSNLLLSPTLFDHSDTHSLPLIYLLITSILFVLSLLFSPPLGFPFPQTCLFAGSLCGKLELILALRLFFSFLFVRMLITKWQLCFCQGMGARYGTQRSVIKFRVFMV